MLRGRRVVRLELLRPDALTTGTRADLARLAGAIVHRVDTRGKYVVLHLGEARLVIQLGMAGQVRIVPAGSPAGPYTHLAMDFDAGLAVHYANPRRIAAGLAVLGGGDADEGPLASLGPEAAEISVPDFLAALAGTRRAVKAVLLDPTRLAGVGNIYSDEALARAGIRPTRRAHRLSRRELSKLHAVVRAVLAEAIAAGGSTLADANPFLDADGRLGRFAIRHRVYGRYGQPCRRCGATLRRATVGGRTSSFCPRCQR